MAYDDEDVWTEEPEVEEQPAPEPYVPPEPEPEPEPPPAAAKKRVYYDGDGEEAPPLAPEAQPEAQPEPPLKQYASYGTDTMTDAAPEPAPAPAPTEPAAKQRRIYHDTGEEVPEATAAAAEGGKKREYYEKPEGAWATFGRELLHGAPAAVTGAVAGAGTGAALGAAGFNPVTVFGGALVGGVIGGVTADVAKDKAVKAAGIEDDAIRRANEKENPWAYRAGSFLSQAFGGSAKAKAVERVLGGGIAGGWEAGSQLIQGKPLNWSDIGTQAAGGALWSGNARPWIRGAEQAGGKFGARFAPTPEAPQPHIPGTPPADVAAPVPPEQGTFPFGAERQPTLPLEPGTRPETYPAGSRPPPAKNSEWVGPPAEQPVAGIRRTSAAQPEQQGNLALEPPTTITPEGQYGFGLEAPHPASKYAAETAARNPMPDGAGSAKEAAPPSPMVPEGATPKQPNANPLGPEGPHSAVVRGLEAQAGEGGPPRGGINVMQPGQVDSTVQHAMAYPAGPRTTFEPPRPPGPGPEPGPAPLPRDRSLAIRPPDTTQGVTEPPIPTDHTRMYQGPGMPPNAFTTNRRAAEQGGPARYVDINPQSMPFFTPGRDGGFTTRNERYQQQLRPIQEVRTEATGPGGKPPPAAPVAPAAPPPTAPAAPAGGAPAAGAKMASPSLEGKLQAAQTGAQTPAKGAQTPATAQMPPVPAATAAQVVQTGKPAVPPKAAAAIATSKGATVTHTPQTLNALGPVARHQAVVAEAGKRYPAGDPKYISPQAIAFENGANNHNWSVGMPIHITTGDVAAAYNAGRAFGGHAVTTPPTGTPPKAAAAIATSKSKGPQEVLIGVSKAGAEVKVKVKPADVSTFREMLDKWGNREGLLKELTPFIRDTVLKLVGNMPVYTVSQHHLAKVGTADAAAFYSRLTNHIVLNRKYANSKVDMEHAILHEGIHAVTAHALKHDAALKGVVNKIMIDVLQKELSHRAAGGHATMEPGTSYGFWGSAKDKTLKNINEREFVTEAFSNPRFQELLRRHELSPNVAKALQDYMGHPSPIVSAWDAIVATVRKMLNVPADKINALEAAMRSTEHSIRLNEGHKQGYMKQIGNIVDVKYKDYSEPGGGHTDAAPAGGQGKVKAYDRDGNEKIFTGSDVHAAAAAARAAGHQPYQIYNMDMSKYKPAQAAQAAQAATPAAAAAPAAGAAGGGPPPGTPTPPAAAAPAAPSAATAAPATTLAGAHASIRSQIAGKPPWYSNIPTTKEAAKAKWREFYTATKNAMDPIEQLKKLSTQPLSPEEDFAMLARLTKGLGGRLTQMMKHGTYDINTGQVNGKSLDAVIKPIADNPDEFANYAVSKRAIELEGRGIKTGMNLADARRIVAEEGHRFEPVLRDLVGFQDRVLQNLVRSGVISQDAAAKMRQMNKEYVPFYRALDPKSELGIQLGAGLQTRNPIFKIKGSDKEVFDPIDSIIKNTYVFTDLAHRNQALVKMRDFNSTLPEANQFMKRDRSSHPIEVKETELQRWMDKHGIEGFADETLTIFRPNAFKPADDKIRLFSNGKAEIYTVPPNVGKAVNAMDQQSMDLWVKIAATPARMLRAGAVLSPEFMLRNPLRDALTAFIQAKHGSIPIVDQLVGLKEIFGKTQHYQDWLINGGANANLVSLDRDILKSNAFTMGGVANKVVSPKQWAGMLKELTIGNLQRFSELSENATRVGMYKRAVDKGVHKTEAAYSAREGTLDFSRIGSHSAVRAANAMIPFLNVHLQGLDSAARAFRDDKVGFLAKVGIGITTPSVLLWFRNKDDERVQQLPAWQRDLFWIVTTDNWKPISTEGRNKIIDQMATNVAGLDKSKLTHTFRQGADGKWEYNDGTIYRIPKPFELGVIFGSIPERILDAYFQTKPDAFKGLSKTMERALVPNYVPQAVLPVMEQWANRSLFLDRTLLTEQQQKLPPAQQYGPHTSESAKVLGSVIRSVAGDKSSFGSPIVVDNYIRQWSGGLGKHVTDIIDAGIKKTQDRAPEPTSSPADWPGYKAFVARFPDRGAQAIQDFYDLRNDRKTEQAGIKEQKKTDPKGAGERLQASSPYIGEPFAKLLKSSRDAVTRITNDKNMTPDDKRTAIDLTYLLMIEHAKRGVEAMGRTKRKFHD